MSTGTGDDAQRYDWSAKVRKLLALAEDPATPPETRDVLMGKIAQLIAEKGLDDALVSATLTSTATVGDRIIKVEGPHDTANCLLLSCIARALGCRTVVLKAVPMRQRIWGRIIPGFRPVHLFGFESDMDGVELLFTSLRAQAGFAWGAGCLFAPNRGFSLYEPYTEFMMGFASTVQYRLERAREVASYHHRQTQAGRGPSTELVLDGRIRQVVERMIEVYPKLTGRDEGQPIPSTANVAIGRTAGQRADFGESRLEDKPADPAE